MDMAACEPMDVEPEALGEAEDSKKGSFQGSATGSPRIVLSEFEGPFKTLKPLNV